MCQNFFVRIWTFFLDKVRVRTVCIGHQGGYIPHVSNPRGSWVILFQKMFPERGTYFPESANCFPERWQIMWWKYKLEDGRFFLAAILQNVCWKYKVKSGRNQLAESWQKTYWKYKIMWWKYKLEDGRFFVAEILQNVCWKYKVKSGRNQLAESWQKTYWKYKVKDDINYLAEICLEIIFK